jgi:hypothetical protein
MGSPAPGPGEAEIDKDYELAGHLLHPPATLHCNLGTLDEEIYIGHPANDHNIVKLAPYTPTVISANVARGGMHYKT